MSDTIPTRQVKQRELSPEMPSLPLFNNDEVEAKLTAFVESQIMHMRDSIHFGAGQELSFSELNKALCTYTDTQLAILALHNTARIESVKAKEAYEDWYADKYLILREEMNPRSLSAQKWISQREIEMAVRVRYKDEFHRYNWDVIVTEQQLNFLRRLLESWQAHQYVLTQLSKNVLGEMSSLGVENTMNRSN